MSSPKVSEKTYCTSLIRLLVFTLTHMTFTRRSSLTGAAEDVIAVLQYLLQGQHHSPVNKLT